MRRSRMAAAESDPLMPMARACLRPLVEAKNDRTLEELISLYKSETTISETTIRLSQSSLWRALTLKRVGLARKKVRDPRQQSREDVVAARGAFRDTMTHVRAEDLVFLDESGIAANLVRLLCVSTVVQRKVCVPVVLRRTGAGSE